VMADLFLLAAFGGFFSVPLYALIQIRAEPSHRARIIAANNILNAIFMIVAALMSKALLDAGLDFPELFLVVGLMNAACAAYIYMLVPEFLMRFICWLLIHSVYRLEKSGIENIPEKGPAMLVCNHVRFVERDPVPVIPIALRGLWGSFFSRKGGPAFSRPGRLFGIFRKIAIVAGSPVAPAAATRESLQATVGEMRGEWR